MGKPRKPQLPKPLPTADRDPEEDAAARAERVRHLVGEGARLLAARRPGEAIPKLEEALSLDPNNVSAAINLGGAYILQGKHQRAVPTLEAASRLEPDNAMVWSNLAAAYLGKLPLSTPEQQERAIAAYERALTIDPRAPNVHYNLGLIYLERNDAERAAAYFHAALQTDPNDRDAQYWLDRIRERQEATADTDDNDDGATC
ncbi:MAG: tetratricopeptide repeat protein [Anaerolineae bacterium]